MPLKETVEICVDIYSAHCFLSIRQCFFYRYNINKYDKIHDYISQVTKDPMCIIKFKMLQTK